MKTIFEQGSFRTYSEVRLDEAREPIIKHSLYDTKTTVFISHKHDDLDDLKGIIHLFQAQYGVKVYIDSQDPTMPKTTNAKTAENIKERIKMCDKFILLATNGAIESKWCNWELGYGDSLKFMRNIAILPIKPKNAVDSFYKGAEYMDIYPYIAYYDGTEKYISGESISKGYYIQYKKDDSKYTITPLEEWFKDK